MNWPPCGSRQLAYLPPCSRAAPHDGTTDMLSHGRWGPKRSCVSVPHGSGSILPGVRWDYDKCTLSTTPLAVRGKWPARSACQWEHDKVARRGPRGGVRASMACGARGVVLIRRCSVGRPPPPLGQRLRARTSGGCKLTRADELVVFADRDPRPRELLTRARGGGVRKRAFFSANWPFSVSAERNRYLTSVTKCDGHDMRATWSRVPTCHGERSSAGADICETVTNGNPWFHAYPVVYVRDMRTPFPN